VAEFRDHTLQDDEIMGFLNTIVCCTIKTVGSHLKGHLLLMYSVTAEETRILGENLPLFNGKVKLEGSFLFN
jgi:hypothetical protein